MEPFTITNIECNEIRPVIVNFQNAKLKDQVENNLSINLFRNEKNQKFEAVATQRLLYVGEVQKEDSNLNNFLIIKNKKTNKAKLVQVDHVTLRPEVPGKSKNAKENNKGSVNDLNKQFGSKRTKRITEQRERMKLNVENVKDYLEETVANIQINESDLNMSQVNENASIYRPPINREAKSKEEVYSLEDIVPDNVINSLENETINLLQGEGDMENLDDFIKRKIINLQNSKSKNSMEKCQLLLYTNFLISFVTTQAKNLARKYVACQLSQEVNNYIIENFTVKSTIGRSRPISMRDKTICHILILLMFALDFEIDAEEVSKSIKLGIKKIQEISRVLSFTVKGNTILLKLPLPAPLSLGTKRKRK